MIYVGLIPHCDSDGHHLPEPMHVQKMQQTCKEQQCQAARGPQMHDTAVIFKNAHSLSNPYWLTLLGTQAQGCEWLAYPLTLLLPESSCPTGSTPAGTTTSMLTDPTPAAATAVTAITACDPEGAAVALAVATAFETGTVRTPCTRGEVGV